MFGGQFYREVYLAQVIVKLLLLASSCEKSEYNNKTYVLLHIKTFLTL